MDFDQLMNDIKMRFWKCNEMSEKQAEDYAWIAVNQLQKSMGLISDARVAA